MDQSLQRALAALVYAVMTHWKAVDTVIGIVAASAVTNMPIAPPPGFRWMGDTNWTWGRDTLQAVVPVRLKDHAPSLLSAPSPVSTGSGERRAEEAPLSIYALRGANSDVGNSKEAPSDEQAPEEKK